MKMNKEEIIEPAENEHMESVEDNSTNGKADTAETDKKATFVDKKTDDETTDTERKEPRKKAQKVGERKRKNKEIELLKEEVKQLKDRYLRKAAEFENFRKRKEKEVLESWDIAKADLLKKLLPVLDDFDRTVEAANNEQNVEALVDGLKLVSKALHKVLEDEKVEAIEAVGKEFDPELHDALMQIEKDDVEPNIVVEETQKGYKKGDRILRHAKVIVSK